MLHHTTFAGYEYSGSTVIRYQGLMPEWSMGFSKTVPAPKSQYRANRAGLAPLVHGQ